MVKVCVFSDTCVFSKRVRFLTFDNAAENQNYSLNSCRVKVFQRTGNTHYSTTVVAEAHAFGQGDQICDGDNLDSQLLTPTGIRT